MKYIDADLLRAIMKEHTLFYAGQANLLDDTNALDGYDEVLAIIDSLQQEQPEKYIELNGIKYKEVPAKTNDKICKDCDYFLDNGKCELVDCCPCIDDDTILERLPEQSEVDLEKEIQNYFQGYWPGMETPEQCNIDMHFTPPAIMRLVKYAYELGFNARNEE